MDQYMLNGLFILLAFCICIIQLYRQYQQLQKKEKALEACYQELNQQTIKHNEKLHNTNNPLYEEIAKHKDTTNLLTEARNFLQNIINSMPSVLIGINRKGIVTHWNTAAQQTFQITYQDALGHPINEVINEPQITMKLIDSSIDKQQPRRLEAIQDGHGNQARFKDITIYPLSTTENEGAVIRIDDVTSRIQLENMIIQNEKMRSLGKLSAGVAHEINNPLGTILQSIQNVQRRLSDTLPANEQTAAALGTDLKTIVNYLEQRKIITFIESIKEAGERSAKILNNMLEFSRSHSFRHDPLQLMEILDHSINLAISSSSLNQEYENIRFTINRHLPDTCPVIYGSATELQQVFLNIINNAYQAYSDNYLNLAVADHTLAGNLTIDIGLESSPETITITISDDGPGMDGRTKKQLFEPFFTTKGVNRGTGLGLSVSYFIINEHHNGSITVDSEKGKGTVFTITLPITKQPNHG